jgi:hypothetical protein
VRRPEIHEDFRRTQFLPFASKKPQGFFDAKGWRGPRPFPLFIKSGGVYGGFGFLQEGASFRESVPDPVSARKRSQALRKPTLPGQ